MSTPESENQMQNRSVAARSLMRTILAFLALTIGLASPAFAGASDEDVQTAWRLLDYVAVDYRSRAPRNLRR